MNLLQKINRGNIALLNSVINQAKLWCMKSVKTRVFFWSLFFRIWTEYVILQNNISISLNLGKKGPKNICIWTFLTQYYLRYFSHFYQLFSIFSPWFSFSLSFSLFSFFEFLLFSMMDYLKKEDSWESFKDWPYRLQIGLNTRQT